MKSCAAATGGQDAGDQAQATLVLDAKSFGAIQMTPSVLHLVSKAANQVEQLPAQQKTAQIVPSVARVGMSLQLPCLTPAAWSLDKQVPRPKTRPLGEQAAGLKGRTRASLRPRLEGMSLAVPNPQQTAADLNKLSSELARWDLRSHGPVPAS